MYIFKTYFNEYVFTYNTSYVCVYIVLMCVCVCVYIYIIKLMKTNYKYKIIVSGWIIIYIIK